jgi:hypothetical protein
MGLASWLKDGGVSHQRPCYDYGAEHGAGELLQGGWGVSDHVMIMELSMGLASCFKEGGVSQTML